MQTVSSTLDPKFDVLHKTRGTFLCALYLAAYTQYLCSAAVAAAYIDLV